ncbi:MAG: hypothetical protein WD005_05010 [Haliea sp.]
MMGGTFVPFYAIRRRRRISLTAPRRAMLISGGDVTVMLQRPVTALLLAAVAAILGWMVWRAFRSQTEGEPLIEDE